MGNKLSQVFVKFRWCFWIILYIRCIFATRAYLQLIGSKCIRRYVLHLLLVSVFHSGTYLGPDVREGFVTGCRVRLVSAGWVSTVIHFKAGMVVVSTGLVWSLQSQF